MLWQFQWIKTAKQSRTTENPKRRNKLGEELCRKCKLPWNEPVSFEWVPLVEEALNINIYIMDMTNIPLLGSALNLWECDGLMYKTEERQTEKQWLLYDENHYHVINNIIAFCAVKEFCHKCFKFFYHKKDFEKHDCAKIQVRPENKNKAIIKDIAHYLKAEFCKGSKRELAARLTNTTSEKRAAHIRDLHNNPRYVIYDLETDTYTLTHKPNHCEVEILKTHNTHDYEKSIVGRKTFEGYGCEREFCEWLFQKENENSTVIAQWSRL